VDVHNQEDEMKITKKQREKIIRKAKKIYLNECVESRGICYAISCAIDKVFGVNTIYDVIPQYIPEFKILNLSNNIKRFLMNIAKLNLKILRASQIAPSLGKT